MWRAAIVSLTMLTWATGATASKTSMTYEQWAQYSDTIVVGHVTLVSEIETRPYRGHEGEGNPYLYPHRSARIVVDEVLKWKDALVVTSGDTISAVFMVGSEGHRARESGEFRTTSVICDISIPNVHAGETWAFVIKSFAGEWFLNGDLLDAVKMRDAVTLVAEQTANGGASRPR